MSTLNAQYITYIIYGTIIGTVTPVQLHLMEAQEAIFDIE